MPVKSSRQILGAITVAIALMVASCGTSDYGPGAILVDPSRYTFYHCDDLTKRSKELTDRERELRDLMEKAGESAGGAVIASIAYRSDYETVLTEERLVQRTAADKKCNPAPEYQSDQTVR